MDACAEAECALMESMRDLLRETSDRCATQFEAARGELDRVQDLLQHAIGDLTHCFQEMHAEARRQAAPAVDALAGRAITALQFQDMVSQLLAHVRSRIDALDAALAQLGGLGDALACDAAGDLRAATAALRQQQGKIATVLRGIEAQTTNNPVGQQSMARGDIELF